MFTATNTFEHAEFESEKYPRPVLPFARKFPLQNEIFVLADFASKQLGNLLSLCREIAGARDILQKFENLKKQHEWNFNL